MQGFDRSLAFVIGIDRYENGVPPLKTATNDAREIAHALRSLHEFEVQLLLDDECDLRSLRSWLRDLPTRVSERDRIVFYFAGHGVALDGDSGPEGYVLAQDSTRSDTSGFLPMAELRESLSALPCHHLLVVLDCCFAGAFRWSATRHVGMIQGPLHAERYEWYIRDAAWQVLTSASHNQKALDVAAGESLGARGESADHSPFASALLDVLRGGTDASGRGGTPVGCVTATETYLYIRNKLESPGSRVRQTPGLWQLPKHRDGEFVFLTPGKPLHLEPAPPLQDILNPWRGLKPYAEEHAEFFFGRRRAGLELTQHILRNAVTVVVGPSGCGKSSLVSAAAIPTLREAAPELFILTPPVRPGTHPVRALAGALASISGAASVPEPTNAMILEAVSDLFDTGRVTKLLLLVDQLEELLTQAIAPKDFSEFTTLLADIVERNRGRVKICCTLRSDYEAPFHSTALGAEWIDGRFLVPQLTQDEYRRIIEEPAQLRVVRFESEQFVEDLINEVVRVPGSLPLLSFVLSEMYRRCVRAGRKSRELLISDYMELHGVAGALHQRVLEEYSRDATTGQAMRRVILRMVSIDGGGEPTRRQAARSEFEYADETERAAAMQVLDRLVEARLVVADFVDDEPIVEPAHDALVRGWAMISEWLRATRASLPTFRAMSLAAIEWKDSGHDPGFLWDEDPRLLIVQSDEETGPVGDLLHLNELEATFIAKSLRRRSSRRVRKLTLSLAIASLLVIGGTVLQIVMSQSSERATTAALLNEMTRLSEEIDGPRQLVSLFSAIDAANLSIQKFGRLVPAVRGGMMSALQRVREVDAKPNPGPQVPDMRSTADGKGVILLYRRDSHDSDASPLVAAVWSTDGSATRREITVATPPVAATLCPSGACILLRYRDSLEIVDENGKAIVRMPMGTDDEDFLPVDGDREHRRIFSISGGDTLNVYEVAHPNRSRSIHLGSGPFEGLITSSNGNKLLALGTQRNAIVDTTTLALTWHPSLSHGSVKSIAFSSDGTFVLYAGKPGEVMEYDTTTRKSTLAARQGNQPVERIALAEDDQTFAFTSITDGAIFVVRRGEDGLLFGGALFAGKQPAIAFSRDGNLLMEIGYLDRTFRTFDLAEPAFPQRTLSEPHVRRLAFCGSPQRLHWGNEEGTIGSYSIDGNDRRETTRLAGPVKRLTCGTDSTVASLDEQGRVDLWPGKGGKVRSERLTSEGMAARDIASSSSGDIFAVVGSKIWRLRPDREPQILTDLDTDDVSRLAVDAAGKSLAVGTYSSGRVEVQKLDGSYKAGPFPAHEGQVFDLAFLPWNDTLASVGTIGGSVNLSLSLWSGTGDQLASVDAHLTLTTALAVDSPSRLLATGGSDGAVRLWDEQLKKVGPDLVRHGSLVQTMAASSNGSVVASAGLDSLVISDLSDSRLIAHACARIRKHTRIVEAASGTLEQRVRAICTPFDRSLLRGR